MRGKKGWVSLSVKLNSVIMVIIIILAGGLAAIAYYVNGQRVDQFFKDNTSEEAKAISYFVDGDFILELRNAVVSQKFQEMREQASKANDEWQLMRLSSVMCHSLTRKCTRLVSPRWGITMPFGSPVVPEV